MKVTVALGSFTDGYIGQFEDKPRLSDGVWQMRPLSRGYVEAKPNRPGDRRSLPRLENPSRYEKTGPRLQPSHEQSSCAMTTKRPDDNSRGPENPWKIGGESS
jgi:hypothetical protein